MVLLTLNKFIKGCIKMDLYKYLDSNIDIKKIENLKGDMYEIALIRYVMKELAKIFNRDYTFFLDKENVKERKRIYNKEFDLKNIEDYDIVCKSYCNIIKELLLKKYDIHSELISSFNDEFRHVDLLIRTKTGRKYIVDPLNDLIEMQVGLRTNNFASKNYYEKVYSKTIKEISFLDEKQLEEIDKKIDYIKNEKYLDDLFFEFKNKIDNLDDLLKEDDKFAKKLLGREYNGEKILQDEKTVLKLKIISKVLNNRKYLNGIVDLLMYSKIVVGQLFDEREQEKIKVCSFWADSKDITNDKLNNLLEDKNKKKRGVVIKFGDKNFIFSLNSGSLEYTDKIWNEILKKNKIFIKPQYPVYLLEYLKANGADRNIVHNNEFLKLFSKFENDLLTLGKSIEKIRDENIFIQSGVIYAKNADNEYISYRVEDGNLVVKDYKRNLKHTIFYNDEGRDIVYNTEKNLSEDDKIYLYEFDSNGLIEIENNSNIEELVEPLNNGKFLSRNKTYYDSKTYSELATERKKWSKILTEESSKRNFVILEYLSNSSAKVYFEELKKKVDGKESKSEEAKKCLEEDSANIIRIFQNEPLRKIKYDLPMGNDKVLERYIEMDNKQILYLFCSSLIFNKEKHILTPGLGSIFVGPMMKYMYGFDYTNILFSLYSKDEKLREISAQKTFEERCSNDKWKKDNTELLLIDDNVGSCNTMNTIRKELEKRGKKCKYGAIKNNWEFYSKVKHGELNHSVFDVKDIDFLTVLDDPGYWIMRDSIKALKEKNGEAYIKVLKEWNLRQEDLPDIYILMKLAEKFSKNSNLDLYDMSGKTIKKSSGFICKKLQSKINEITREFKNQEKVK